MNLVDPSKARASLQFVEATSNPTGEPEPTPHLQVGHPDFVPLPDEPAQEVSHMRQEIVAPETPLLQFRKPDVPTKVDTRTQIIILNGPPNVGKDTLVRELSENYNATTCSFKNPMFDIALAASGIRQEDWDARYNDRSLKEQPWDRLNGMTCRQFMINISEDFIKPLFGNDHFGKLACDQVREGLNIFTDGGFPDETRTLLEEFGQRNVKVVRLMREDCTFAGDSRNYLVDGIAKNTFDVFLEKGDIEQGIFDLEYVIGK